MAYNEKSEEVQFYLDRAAHSALTIMRSILHNPRLKPTEQVELIQKISTFHGSLALELQKGIHGTNVSITLRE